MNSYQIKGSTRKAVGNVRESAGNLLGDQQPGERGVIDQAAGAIQHGYGQAKVDVKTITDGAPDIVDAARKLGRRNDDAIQNPFGASVPVYIPSGAIAFWGLAIFWAGRERAD